MSDLWQQVDAAKRAVEEQISAVPSVAIIAGSGLSPLSGMINNPVVLSYSDLPFFPTSYVEHHPSKLLFGTIEGIPVLLFNGRYHLYEGHSPRDIAFLVYVAKALGVTTLITTNSAGALRSDATVGSLMLISDQINGTGLSPLQGEHDYRFGPRFPSMHNAYSSSLQERVRRCAQESSIALSSGVYVGIQGPETETPAEAQKWVQAGASAIGMSTVFETIAAVQCGLEVLGISVLTDAIDAVDSGEPITPKAAKKAAQVTVNSLIQLIKKVLKNYV